MDEITHEMFSQIRAMLAPENDLPGDTLDRLEIERAEAMETDVRPWYQETCQVCMGRPRVTETRCQRCLNILHESYL